MLHWKLLQIQGAANKASEAETPRQQMSQLQLVATKNSDSMRGSKRKEMKKENQSIQLKQFLIFQGQV